MTAAAELQELQREYERLLQRLAPEVPRSPFHAQVQTRPTHNGDAHVEWIDGRFDYVVTERGAELHRRTAADRDELLYWLFDDVTASLAWRRRASFWARWRGHDARRQRFAWHRQLLARIDPAWAERKRKYHEETLREHPFRDRR